MGIHFMKLINYLALCFKKISDKMLGVNGPQAEQNEIEKLSPLNENCLITPDLSN